MRVWLEPTDDDSSRLVVRQEEVDKASEVRWIDSQLPVSAAAA